MHPTEIKRAVLHELEQELTRARMSLLERELAQTRGNIQRLTRRKKQSKTPAAPSLSKLQNELHQMQNELQELVQSLTPCADGAPKTDRANGTN